MLLDQLLRVQAAASGPNVADLFSVDLYTGNGASQSINNGLDLTVGDALVWLKGRSGATDHALYDTVRGATKDLRTCSVGSDAQTTQTTGLTAFNANGFSLGSLAKLNTNTATYAAWTFKAAEKFFDIVEFTGTGVAHAIGHALGVAPGCIVAKGYDADSRNWMVYHVSLGATQYGFLNGDQAFGTASTIWNNAAPTSTQFSVGTNANVNASGAHYVAYLFADDPDGVVQCDSFTTNSSGAATIALGWEPGFVLLKCSSTTGDWLMLDTTRGWASGSDKKLSPNLSAAEVTATDYGAPSSTGFSVTGLSASQTYVYMAIRKEG